MTKQELLNALRKEQAQLLQLRDKTENAMQYVKHNERANEVSMIINLIATNFDEPKAEPKVVEPKAEPKVVEPKAEEPKVEKEKVRKS